jgi:hypothetical protein
MDYVSATLAWGPRRRANFENFSFFQSCLRLTRVSGKRSCTCGQKWNRTSTNCTRCCCVIGHGQCARQSGRAINSWKRDSLMNTPGIREHLRWRGAPIVFLLGLRELLRPLFYWHVWHIHETDISCGVPQAYCRTAFDVAIHTSRDDLSSIKPDILAMGELSADEVNIRFQRGDAVALASASGQPVGYMWMGFSSGIELEFDTFWIIRADEAVRYGAFVIPFLRGRGVYSLLNSTLNAYALERSVTRTLGSVSVLNPQSLSLPRHYNRAIAMTVFLARLRVFSFTVRKSFRAPLSYRFSWSNPSRQRDSRAAEV